MLASCFSRLFVEVLGILGVVALVLLLLDYRNLTSPTSLQLLFFDGVHVAF